jgi:MFS family permease
VTAAAARSSHTLAGLIALGILNHSVLAGGRVTVSLYALGQGASAFVVGSMMALYSFLPMLLAVGAGRLSDRIGVRRPMLVGSCGIALAAVLPALVPGLAILFVTTALTGMSFMLFQVAAQNATGALGAPEDRPRNFGFLALGYSVSGLAGPLIAGFTIDHASFRASFTTLALLPLVPIAVLGRGALALPHPHPAQARAAHGGVAALFRNAHLRRVFAVNGLLSMAWDLNTFFIPIYGARLGLSASMIGVILASFAAATFVVRLAMPWIARRFSELQVLAAALFVSGAVYALFPLVGSVGPLVALSFTLGLALGSGQPMVMSLLHSMVPAGRMGEAVGVRMAIINASTFAVPLFFGAVGSSLGSIAPVLWVVGGALAGGGFYARRRESP